MASHLWQTMAVSAQLLAVPEYLIDKSPRITWYQRERERERERAVWWPLGEPIIKLVTVFISTPFFLLAVENRVRYYPGRWTPVHTHIIHIHPAKSWTLLPYTMSCSKFSHGTVQADHAILFWLKLPLSCIFYFGSSVLCFSGGAIVRG